MGQEIFLQKFTLPQASHSGGVNLKNLSCSCVYFWNHSKRAFYEGFACVKKKNGEKNLAQKSLKVAF